MINIDALNDDEKLAALESIHKSIAESKEIQKKKITTNVELIVKALKKIESDLKQRYDETGQLIANLKNGEDGRDGKDGKDGKNGRDGRDGPVGPRGYDGVPGRNGIDGTDGVSVTDAHIDFDGSLIISLSSGRVINVGEVVAADIAEKIKVITNGGGTSQGVLDAIASLQAQIDSIASGLEYQGTWNASTNVPTLTSSVGTAGYYYIVATAGSTNLNGVTDWQIGDWAVFNGSVWQKIDQTNLVTSVAGRTGAVVLSNTDISGLGTMSTQAANNVSITGGSIAGITDLAIADGGTGQSTAAAAITALTGTQTSGYYLRSNGTSASLSAISAGDVPTLNQNTTGTAAGLSATLATSSGGTGLTSFTADGVPYATSTSVLATSGLLKFQATNSALTVAATTTSNGYVGFTNSADGGTQGYIGDAKALITPGINSALAVRGEDAILFGIAATEGMRLNSTGLGIGKTAGSALDVKGTLRLSGSTSGYVGLAPAAAAGSTTYTLPTADGTANQALVTNGSGTLSWASTAVGTVTSVAASVPTFLSISGSPITSSGTLAITLSGTALPTTSGGTGLTSFTSGGVVYASSTSALTTGSALTFNGTSLGVGTSSPNYLTTFYKASLPVLQIANSTSGSTSADGFLIYLNGANATISNEEAGALNFQTSGLLRATLDSSGNLGIGTSSPSTKLVVSGTTTALDSNGQILATVTDAVAADKGGQIMMGGYYTGTTPTAFAGIAGKKENGTSGSFSGYLQFLTSTGGTGNTEKARIDSAGNLGIGTSSPTEKLEVMGGNIKTDAFSRQIGYWEVDAVHDGYFVPYNASGHSELINSFATGAVLFKTGTSKLERMRLDSSGNLGIGTSSPASQLDVSKTGDAIVSLTSAGVQRYQLITRSGGNFEVYDQSSAASRLTLTQSGNLGLGVTPSAWGSNWKATQSGVTGAFASTGAGSTVPTAMVLGAYNDNTNWKYQYTSVSSARYEMTGANAGSTHAWYISAGGTAGNNITFTQAMTLDASGNLGIGTTSPSVKLDVSGGISGQALNAAGTAAAYTSTGGAVLYTQGSGLAVLRAYSNAGGAAGTLTFIASGSENARIDSSGRFGIGVTPSAWGSGYKVLQIGNAGFMNSGASTWFYNNSYFDGTNNIYSTTAAVTRYVQASGAHNWDIAASGTAGTSISFTQAMTLTSAGELLVGTTSNGTYTEKFNVTTGSATQTIMNLVATGTSSFGAVKFRNGSGEIGSISYLSAAVVYNTTSDYRLKTVIGAVTGHGARIDALEPIEYEWKSDGSRTRGFLAHKFQEVYAGSVTGTKDAVDADGNPVYQQMQASTSEVIADLVAEIQSLRKRLADAGI